MSWTSHAVGIRGFNFAIFYMSITKFQAKCDLINFKGNPTVFVPLVCENVLKLTGTHVVILNSGLVIPLNIILLAVTSYFYLKIVIFWFIDELV